MTIIIWLVCCDNLSNIYIHCQKVVLTSRWANKTFLFWVCLNLIEVKIGHQKKKLRCMSLWVARDLCCKQSEKIWRGNKHFCTLPTFVVASLFAEFKWIKKKSFVFDKNGMGKSDRAILYRIIATKLISHERRCEIRLTNHTNTRRKNGSYTTSVRIECECHYMQDQWWWYTDLYMMPGAVENKRTWNAKMTKTLIINYRQSEKHSSILTR